MAGLLDFLGDGFDDPRSAALMALSAGLMQRNFGGGLLAANNAYAQSKEAKAKQGLLDMQMKNYQSEIDQRGAETAQKQALIEAEKRKREALPGLFGGGAAPAAPGQLGSGSFGAMAPAGGQPDIPAAAGRPGQINWLAALQAGYKPDEISKLAELPNAGRAEVARTVSVPGPNGEKMLQQIDKFGDPVGKPMSEFEAAQFLNLGNRQVAAIPRPGMSFQMGQSPDSVASNAVAWANNRNAAERLSFEKSQANKPQYDGERGVLIDTRQGTASPVVGLDGQQIGPKNKDLTDSQAKANLFGTRAQEANRILGGLQGKYSPMAVNAATAAERVPLVGGMVGGTANWLLTEDGQQAEQAQRDFVNAVLRRESGAAIAPAEFANAQKQYFPQPNDGPKVLAQKARARQIAVEGILAEVPGNRRGVPTLTSPGSEQPANAAGKTVERTGVYGGKKVVQYSDGTTEYAN